MEMPQLRYVVAVARARNFARAAEQCHVSQPSLSQQIQKLEEELGERLFDRMKREAKLTPHGEAFLPRALKILEEVDVAKREASDAHRLLRGRVIVGVLPTIAPYLLPAALVDFAEEVPGVETDDLFSQCSTGNDSSSRPFRRRHLACSGDGCTEQTRRCARVSIARSA